MPLNEIPDETYEKFDVTVAGWGIKGGNVIFLQLHFLYLYNTPSLQLNCRSDDNKMQNDLISSYLYVDKTIANVLQKLTMPIMNIEKCKSIHADILTPVTPKANLCAGGEKGKSIGYNM